MSQITFDSNLIVMLFATQLVFTLYGAGIRRPFGSLVTIVDLPRRLRRATALTVAADLLFVAFLIFMWSFFITRMDLIQFAILAIAFGVVGHYLSHRIPLVPSFFIALALAACCIIGILQFDGGQPLALSIQPLGK
jgi:hypothetical protein